MLHESLRELCGPTWIMTVAGGVFRLQRDNVTMLVTPTAVRNHPDIIRQACADLCSVGTGREWVRYGFVVLIQSHLVVDPSHVTYVRIM